MPKFFDLKTLQYKIKLFFLKAFHFKSKAEY